MRCARVGPVLHLSMRLVLTYWLQGGQSSDSIGSNVVAQLLSYCNDPYLSLAVQVARMRTCPVLNTMRGPFRWACPCIGLSEISAGRVCGCAREAVPRRFTITTAT
ncbi:hypothetical protein DFH08DRAFT_902546 [Mycena albidolilacea]|uniref:Secreted protein n=1 Tax=Mycena albidolilacea TaxID=1033008 RepID=A0AAD6Z3M6_9AGAR|nr:hypothetical protein DFH08DRAFT_902546 [Mycena albidolilacea]